MKNEAPPGVDAIPPDPPTVEGIDEQDFECDPVGSADYVKRLARPDGTRVPQILWGHVFESWPIRRQLASAKELASSMNEALKTEQSEKLEVIKAALHQEEIIKKLNKAIADNNDTMQRVTKKLSNKVGDLTKQIMMDAHKLRKLQMLVKGMKPHLTDGQYDEARAFAEGMTVEEWKAHYVELKEAAEKKKEPKAGGA